MYLGGASSNSLNASSFYNFERGLKTCATENGINCSGQERATSIVQNIGLMYISDYMYSYANGVDSVCYTNGSDCNNGTPNAGWLFNSSNQWSLSIASKTGFTIYPIRSNGFVSDSYDSDSYNANGVRPSLFLNSSVKITSGDGSQSNPYIIE